MLGFTINEALKNREQVTNLEATRVRVEALQAFSALSGDIYRLLRLPNSSPIRESAYTSANKEFDLILQYNKQLEGLSAQWDIANSLRDFNQVLIELQQPSPAQRPYLGVLAFDVLQEILVELNDVDIFLADDSIKIEGKIFSDLNNFVFWTQKEAWVGYKLYLYPELREDSLDHYLSTIHRQSQYLNAFIRNSDSSIRLRQLIDVFASKEYQESIDFRERIFKRQFDSQEIKHYVSGLEQRHVVTLQVVDSYTAELQGQLAARIEEQKIRTTLTTMFVITLASLVFWLTSTTSLRLNRNLSYILNGMSDQNRGTGEHKPIETEGHDELTQFADKVNEIMSDNQQHYRDLIEAKEDAISANRAKSAFLANMSHEIRTPLNGIIGMAEILSQSQLNANQQEVLSDIESSSHTLLVLLNDILDLSKIESGNLLLSPQAADLREVVYDSVSVILSKAISKNVELNINIDANTPHQLLFDEHRLRQVMTNLLSNAIKFTDSGAISTTVTYTPSSETRGMVECQVADTGIGIEESKLDSIFEPFTQEDGSITRQFGGTGLGLAICRQLIDLMDGRIAAMSVKGEGSKFIFSFYVDTVESKPKTFDNLKTALIVSNSFNYVAQLSRECERFGIQSEVVPSINDISNSQLDCDVLLYCHTLHQQMDRDLAALKQRYPISKVIVCQHHLFKTNQITESVHSTHTVPFLGKRFSNSLLALDSGVSQAADKPTKSEDVHELNRRILIVEDNLMNQKIASFFLEKAGYEYIITSNGQEAVDVVTQGEQFDAILMDCMMPVMDGITATQAIRAWEKEQGIAPLPIIALTASVLDEDIKDCFEAGMNAYLPKPYKSHQLYELFDSLGIV
ncbi:ATP-binding protein [Vibrio fortis]|jgi:signal transduction histidine kinase/ActR/RegA family two-component response regulator|uniref:hybrid sensor histidine kinase/response regulator n=1 Tax=Vibrio fortis TaxID=212667 RepID=UPI003EB887EF